MSFDKVKKYLNATPDGKYYIPSWNGEAVPWREVLAWVKESFDYKERSFDGTIWKVKATNENRQKFAYDGWTLIGNALFLSSGTRKAPEKIKSVEIDKSFIHKELMPYQIEGAGMIAYLEGNALLADPMGLGKTAQVCTYMGAFREETLPAIVICPATGREHWKRELKKWAGIKNTVAIYGSRPYKLPKADVYIIGYDILKNWIDTLQEMNPKYTKFMKTSWKA